MAKFRYRMQSILDLQLKLEDQAKVEFAQAQGIWREQVRKLNELKERKAAYMEEARRLRAEILDFTAIRENENAQEMLKELIRLQKIEVARAEKEMDRRREILQEHQIDRKTQEKLRDKALSEFLIEEARKESREADEHTSYEYGRRQING
ncbi:MAG: flagellar export protein FliJ [Lachnospiraceae bacterium]|nr:flagellar export protein FliJ [Lachnospiraceae bacterium]